MGIVKELGFGLVLGWGSESDGVGGVGGYWGRCRFAVSKVGKDGLDL